MVCRGVVVNKSRSRSLFNVWSGSLSSCTPECLLRASPHDACPNKYSTPKSRFSFSHYQPGYVPRRAAGERLPRYSLSQQRICGDHRYASRRRVHHEKMVRVLSALPALVHRVSLMLVAFSLAALLKFADNKVAFLIYSACSLGMEKYKMSHPWL